MDNQQQHQLWLLAGLATLVIEDHIVFPDYDGRELCIQLDDDGLILMNWLTGEPVPWRDLTAIESERMAQNMALQHHLKQTSTLN
jgi:hypothetical protein